MTKRILYQTDEGGVAVLSPTPEAIEQYGLNAIVFKDVPAGKPFKIVNESDIPTDRTFRAAWEVDIATLTDGEGADYGAGSDWDVFSWGANRTPEYLVNRRTGESKKVSET